MMVMHESPLRIVYANLTFLGDIAPNDEARMVDALNSPDTVRITPLPAAPAQEHEALRETARALEASFLSEMLKHAGFGESRESFGGGAGEDQFASMLRDEHARLMADRGGIGLAEQVFRALVARSADTTP